MDPRPERRCWLCEKKRRQRMLDRFARTQYSHWSPSDWDGNTETKLTWDDMSRLMETMP
jgi:hypothetical protein